MKPGITTSLLIVDDNAADLEALKTHYRDKYNVSTAKTAAAALALIRKRLFAAAIVDILLPDMNGEKLLEALKKQWPLTEVIMITAAGGEDVAQACFEKGAIDYFDKPYKLPPLDRAVRRAVQLSELGRQLEAAMAGLASKGAKGGPRRAKSSALQKSIESLAKAYVGSLDLKAPAKNLPLSRFLETLEAAVLKELMVSSHWNVSHASIRGRMHRFNLRNKLKRHKITTISKPRAWSKKLGKK